MATITFPEGVAEPIFERAAMRESDRRPRIPDATYIHGEQKRKASRKGVGTNTGESVDRLLSRSTLRGPGIIEWPESVSAIIHFPSS